MHKKFFQAAVCIVGAAAPVYSQSIQDQQYSPDSYDSQIAKEIVKALSEPPERLKKLVVDFVNNSKSPLMCKLEVKPVYEQHMRSSANNQHPEVSKILAKEMVIRLQAIDEYCASSK